MSEEEYDVQVYVYDLSHGLARIYSPMVLGTTIEAIYHTSVVVRNKEYYLDQGIKVNSPPGHTKYGTPIEVLNIGKTSVDDELINDFLNDLRNHDEMKYHAINYNLFTNNCNHFSDVLLEFLCNSLNKFSFDSKELNDVEYRNKFWSSTPNSSLNQQPGPKIANNFQPLGKDDSYNRYRSESFPKEDSFNTSYTSVSPNDTFDAGSSTNKYLKNTMMNAPSYVPSGFNNYNNNNNKYYYKKDDSYETLQEDYNNLKSELLVKNQIIKNLTDQLNIMRKNENQKNAGFALPKNHYQLFQDLSKTLQEKSIELQETNQRLEAVLVANNLGEHYDVEELSHKLVYKLSQLSQENENLLKMVSFGNKTSLLIEIGLLKHEIQQLKKDQKK
ncbi:hypothetical protein G210_1671 [Candida maltosa Xu316]|uniref:PPPDE domain-containing protein n=1 Tax=Candida maltosa (strain Xu316) TaxID=1245528 RepID=M3JY16_CANMX|nr:hypothetical protein G210_1671 [Candida maltosa Xu316]